MMYEFLINNRANLAMRCREKIALRPGRRASELQMKHGVPMFVDQLIRTVEIEKALNPLGNHSSIGKSSGGIAVYEIGISAAAHGRALLELDFSVDQVIHDYGELWQAITDLAIENNEAFKIDEFRSLNRCLDNAIANAVAEFSYQRDFLNEEKIVQGNSKRLGYLVHELRNLLGTISLAFTAAKSGSLNLSGATGAILERSILNLSKVIESAREDIKDVEQAKIVLSTFSVASFITEAHGAAELSAKKNSCDLKVLPVDADLGISGSRDLLLAALASILQNVFEFTRPQTRICLSAYAFSDQIRIDVAYHDGGFPPGAPAVVFTQDCQGCSNGAEVGLDLAMAKQGVEEYGGTLSVHNIPTVGCIFTISLPRRPLAT
ncbi:sensor histidine kinase [Janthinobacterium lividum]